MLMPSTVLAAPDMYQQILAQICQPNAVEARRCLAIQPNLGGPEPTNQATACNLTLKTAIQAIF